MIKTSYQTPELRDANNNIIQPGAFGKNTALSNSTNDGWIDYVMNNLEALHDVVGETSPTLDGNGHVVEPANKAIGDEDGLRIKNNYLKLSGGKVTGVTSFRTDLRMLDNQDNRWGGLYVPGTTSSVQYLSLYGGTRATGDARLNLFALGNGKFELVGYSTDGANAYPLTHDNDGRLKWRGNELALKKDVLPLSGGAMTGNVRWNMPNAETRLYRTDEGGKMALYGGVNWSTSANLYLNGNASNASGQFALTANDGTNSKALVGKPDGTLTWDNKSIERVSSYANNCIRYESGIQICYGIVGSMTSAGITVTFSQPFAVPPVPFFATSSTANQAYLTEVTATDMTVKTSNNSGYIRYIAIGRWK